MNEYYEFNAKDLFTSFAKILSYYGDYHSYKEIGYNVKQEILLNEVNGSYIVIREHLGCKKVSLSNDVDCLEEIYNNEILKEYTINLINYRKENDIKELTEKLYDWYNFIFTNEIKPKCEQGIRI